MKNQVKTRAKSLYRDTKMDATRAAMWFNSPRGLNKIMRTITMTTIVLLVVSCFALPAFAAGETVFDKAKSLFGEIYTSILSISTVMAVVAESVAACFYFFSSNGKAVSKLKKSVL